MQVSQDTIHAKFQNDEAIIEIPEGNLIEGRLPVNKMKLVQVWVEIHKDELMANWQLAKSGETVFKIEGLK